MCPNSTLYPALPCLPFTHVALPIKENKSLKKILKAKQCTPSSSPPHPSWLCICCSGSGTYGVSRGIPTHLPRQLYWQMFIAWCGLRPQHLPQTSATPSTLDPHRNFSQVSLLLPQSWRPCSPGSAGPVPSCTPAGHRWGR